MFSISFRKVFKKNLWKCLNVKKVALQFDEFFDVRCTCFQIARVVFDRSVSQQCFDCVWQKICKFQSSRKKTRETLFTFKLNSAELLAFWRENFKIWISWQNGRQWVWTWHIYCKHSRNTRGNSKSSKCGLNSCEAATAASKAASHQFFRGRSWR